jgi:hypothetical protein
MFQNLITYPIESPLLKWESKIVVLDHDREAGLYLRVKLTGTVFPILNSIPFVQLGKVKARFVKIADDGLSVKAYFDSALPRSGTFEFGYDDQALLRFPDPYRSGLVTRLDNSRLPRHLRYQEKFFDHSPPQ